MLGLPYAAVSRVKAPKAENPAADLLLLVQIPVLMQKISTNRRSTLLDVGKERDDGLPELGKKGAEEVIAACSFPETVRGETLGIPEFAKIANEIVRRRNAK